MSILRIHFHSRLLSVCWLKTKVSEKGWIYINYAAYLKQLGWKQSSMFKNGFNVIRHSPASRLMGCRGECDKSGSIVFYS